MTQRQTTPVTLALAAPRPGQVLPPDLPGVNSLLTLTAGVVVVGALFFGRTVLIPVTLAILLSFLLAPIVSVLRRIGLPRVPAVILVMVAALSVLAAAAVVIGFQLASLSEGLPSYEVIIDQKVSSVRAAIDERVLSLRAELGNMPSREAPVAPKSHGPATGSPRSSAAGSSQNPPAGSPQNLPAGSAQNPPAGSAQNPITVTVTAPEPDPVSLAREFLEPVVSPLGTTALVLVIAIFVMLQQDDLRDRLIRLFGSSDLHRTTTAMNDAGRRLSKYFLAQLAINAGFGLLIGLGLFAVGVPSAAVWGFIAMLMRFVPYVGIFIAAVPATLLAASIDIGWTPTFLTLAIFVIGELIVSQVIEPLAYGHSTGLSPVSIVVTTIFWAWIWGPVGLILATPLTLCLVVLGRHVKRLEFLDVLLGDRPALTPVESFYQRILANDPDEASAQAERLLRERPLSVYYDEVAMRALAMAGFDVVRGVLGRERLLVMREAVLGVIEELDDYDDAMPSPRKQDDGALAPPASEQAVPHAPVVTEDAPSLLPPGWSGEAAVMCLGGRSPLDDAAGAMLAQLLGKHELPARAIAHDELSRGALAAFDFGGVGILCVSYTTATGSPAHLRVLLRRLRRHAGPICLLLGLWVGEDEEDEELWEEAVALADRRVGSLRGALAACLEVAGSAAAAAPLEVAAAV